MSNITLAYLYEEIVELCKDLNIEILQDELNRPIIDSTEIKIKYLNEPIFIEFDFFEESGLKFIKKIGEYNINISKFEYYKISREVYNKLKIKYNGKLKPEIEKEFEIISNLRIISDKLEIYQINKNIDLKANNS